MLFSLKRRKSSEKNCSWKISIHSSVCSDFLLIQYESTCVLWGIQMNTRGQQTTWYSVHWHLGFIYLPTCQREPHPDVHEEFRLHFNLHCFKLRLKSWSDTYYLWKCQPYVLYLNFIKNIFMKSYSLGTCGLEEGSGTRKSECGSLCVMWLLAEKCHSLRSPSPCDHHFYSEAPALLIL